ncbi:MAG: maltose ABC transporter substrate-binding protein [Spirochaetaceae bacterium]|jgi:arabinogalactan oligomer/maltooligosaccharide transport system substrate-binding protein|nr:maltose ABC transporter substrate-binding protein [Spirochaetaceae bacterium]
MKKIGFLGFSMALVALLGACSKSQSGGDAAARSSGGSGSSELVVWMDNDEWAEAVIAAFKQKYPDVAVSYQKVGNVDTRGKVSLDGPAGIGPDVFLMPHDHIGLAVADGLCEPFDAELQGKYAQTMLEASIKTCTAKGTLYAVPISTENIAFFYNKDLLGDKPVPRSFEEIIAFAQEYNNPAQNKWALRWQVDDAYLNYFFLTAFGANIFGPNMDDYRNPGFDSPEVAQGMEFHQSLRAIYNVNVADADGNATVVAFQNGEVPFTFTGPWSIADAKKNGVNFGVTKLPTIKGVQPRCFSGNIIAAVSSYAKNFDAAFAFVDFLASVEGQTIQFNKTGKLTTLKDPSLVGTISEDPYLMGIAEQSPYVDLMPIIPEANQMWGGLKDLFTFTWDKTLTTAEAQAKAMDTYDTALQMAGKKR